ncbi:MAG: V-type ATP synthase subunit B [Candidatus Helarchaeota archaeon]
MTVPSIILNRLNQIIGPLIFIDTVKGLRFGEMVEVIAPDGSSRKGRILQINKKFTTIETFEGTFGLSLNETKINFLQDTFKIGVSSDLLGRTFNGMGEPIDKLPEPFVEDFLDINGSSINPVAREYPRDFIQTGISTIDCLNSIVRGQKLPIFSGSGLPHNLLTAQIISQAKTESEEEFAIVFVGMGISHDDATFFMKRFTESGIINNVILFLNLADNPPMERLVTPRIGLTVAEYLALTQNMHILVIMTDMTLYAEALKVISSSKGEIPSRKGYPGYLYSDFASIFERSGRIKGKRGSITQIPILTMPNDDIEHPVPDLTGYITEGQIILDRALASQGIYPPVNVLTSLSRLMKDGIGEGKTREDHGNVASQLYASFAKVKDVEALASIIGEKELVPIDKKYLEFGREFQSRFVNQGVTENREIEETLDLAWDLLSILPEKELTRIKDKYIQKYRKMPV